jgi:hypothetical protein
VIDASTPTAPTITGTVVTPGNAMSVDIDGDYAYVADTGGGLQVVDVSTPSTPTIVGSLATTKALKVKISGTHAFLADSTGGLVVIDISAPTMPSFAGSIEFVSPVESVDVVGDLAFVADGTKGLQIVDVSDPTNPTLVSNLDTPSRATGIAATPSHVFIADRVSVRVIDVTVPANPVSIGEYVTNGVARSARLIQDRMFIGDATRGVLILPLDCGDATPVLIDAFDISGASDRVWLRWTSLAIDATDFRITAVRDGRSWPVPVREVGAGRFEAVDTSRELAAGGDIEYVLEARDEGQWTVLRRVTHTIPPVALTQLSAARPNPFLGTTVVSYDLGRDGRVQLDIYDAAGRLVRSLVDGVRAQGPHVAEWDGTTDAGEVAPPGAYLVRLETVAGTESRKLIRLR